MNPPQAACLECNTPMVPLTQVWRCPACKRTELFSMHARRSAPSRKK